MRWRGEPIARCRDSDQRGMAYLGHANGSKDEFNPVENLRFAASGQVRYKLRTPYRDGTTHIVLEPLDLMARPAALVPPPRMHLTRFHGVLALNSMLRVAVTPAHRGSAAAKQPVADPARPPTPRPLAMNWARRLKRVLGIEVDRCARCGGQLKIIASIEDPQVIANILSHLGCTAPEQYPPELPQGARAPPVCVGTTGRGGLGARSGFSEFSGCSGGLAWAPDLSGKSCRR